MSPPVFKNHEINASALGKDGIHAKIPIRPHLTRRLFHTLSSVTVLLYTVFFIFYSGTLVFCQRDPVPCPEPVLHEDKVKFYKFWQRKKAANLASTSIPPPEDDDILICENTVYALNQVRSVLPLLENVSLLSIENDINTCPNFAVPNQDNDGNKPLKRIVNHISTFVKKITSRKRKHNISAARRSTTSYEKFSTDQLELINELAILTRESLNDNNFNKRVKAISWGGNKDLEWWSLKRGEEEGQLLLGSYLKIMKWPKDQQTNFPFKPCKQTCPITFALAHSIEFREKFQPWLITSSVVNENKVGWIYHHGHSPHEGPSIVWYRPGVHKFIDSEAYLRTMVTTLEFAITDAMQRSKSKMGQFDVVVDCHEFKLAFVPKLDQIKRLFTILQDHFPNRLGHVLIANMSAPAQFMMRLVLPFLTEDVRKKIHIVPNAKKERMEMLNMWIGEDFIPEWLGGTDKYSFDAKDYYRGRVTGSEQDGRKYLKTMPYHA